MQRFTLLCTLLAACYEPDAVDCTVQCSGVDQCADGQVCGTDGFCASPDVAGTCMMAGSESQLISLTITIEGHGKVTIDGVGTCDSESPNEGVCTYAVAAGVARQLKAMPAKDREFISWTSTCTGSQSTCTLTPVMSLTQVGAKFE
ncbi:MAG TPA: hypothetical protein VIV40_38070 [Kofleriaceae bacterium]